ncbi:ATP-dependent Clp protease ATP-binding subunit [bacterium]|nr:ATP-dependent Clp protease ATP-binding subunit [bacterium]
MANLNNFNPNNGSDTNNPNAGTPSGPIMMGGHMDDEEFDPKDYLINYNEKFANDNPTLFRDSVIQQTLSCLIGKFKPNALLIGAAGVGKTKIVEDIARRIATNDPLIPDQLAGHTVWELPLSSIVAGSGIVGEIERKTKAILEFAQTADNKVILFIDEIHMLVGESQIYDKIAQLMKPALARGDMKVIGATTLQESQNLMDDPAFNRRFTRLIVDELSKEQTKVILDQMKVSLFNHYNNKIAITDKIIDEVVTIADEHKTVGSHRPDNAITLLDRAMADAFIQRKILEESAKDDPTMLAAIQAVPTISLSKSQMKKTAMKLMTGNNEKTNVDINVLRNQLSVIKGQDDILEYLLDAIERDNLNIYPRTKPLTLLFAGNSGVGKSEVSKIIAQELTGTKPIILNMTEYNSSASINRIIGAPAGYVGSDSKTELPFDILESNPYQVILLDEFEKCDKAVQRLFMSAFDEGYIKTARGKEVDFSKAIIIATTNAGHTNKSDSIGFTQASTNSVAASISELSAFFDVELLNRFTKVLNFNAIDKTLFIEILKDTYSRQITNIKSVHSSYGFMPDELPDDVVETLVKNNYAKEFGARPIKRTIQKYIEDTILDYKRAKNNTPVTNDTD